MAHNTSVLSRESTSSNHVASDPIASYISSFCLAWTLTMPGCNEQCLPNGEISLTKAKLKRKQAPLWAILSVAPPKMVLIVLVPASIRSLYSGYLGGHGPGYFFPWPPTCQEESVGRWSVTIILGNWSLSTGVPDGHPVYTAPIFSKNPIYKPHMTFKLWHPCILSQNSPW